MTSRRLTISVCNTCKCCIASNTRSAAGRIQQALLHAPAYRINEGNKPVTVSTSFGCVLTHDEPSYGSDGGHPIQS